jgi:GT2 family glycosyltransferase
MEYDGVEVVVVDNASTDGTVAAIRESFGDSITVIVNDANLGFSEGNNVGIRYALERGVDYILLLNNDTTVDPKLIGGLVDGFTKSPDVGIVGPKIYYASPPDQIWFAGGEVSLARGTARHIGIREKDRGQFESIREVDYITGCALMAKREVFERVGYLDSSYVAYFEDTDFCMRAKRCRFKILYVPAGIVWHRISFSTGGQLSAKKISRKLRSTVKFLARYASLHHWLTIPFFILIDVVRIVVFVSTGRIRNTGEVGNTTKESSN